MKRNVFFLNSLFFLASIACGYLAASWIELSGLLRLRETDSAQWQPIGAPPGGASRIISIGPGSGSGDVVVLSRNGKTYACCSQFARIWEEIEKSQELPASVCGTKTAIPVRNLPGRIADCAETSYWKNAAGRSVFVVLEDGAVWSWRVELPVLTPLVILFVCSLLGGLTLGAFFLWLWRRARHTSPPVHNKIILSR
jgi:hypothetical protein